MTRFAFGEMRQLGQPPVRDRRNQPASQPARSSARHANRRLAPTGRVLAASPSATPTRPRQRPSRMSQQLTAVQQRLEINKWLHNGNLLRHDTEVVGLN
jgi:hypothetical protein